VKYAFLATWWDALERRKAQAFDEKGLAETSRLLEAPNNGRATTAGRPPAPRPGQFSIPALKPLRTTLSVKR